MKRTKQLLAAVSATALVAVGSSPAMAAGTTAGDPIVNNVSVAFKVNDVDQTAATDNDTIIVDRKVNVTVAEVGNNTTSVGPGQTQQATTFQVQNLSNDTIDLDLSTSLPGTNDFTLTNIKFYVDDGAGVFDATLDTEVTYLDEMTEDQIRVVHVVADIPIDATTGQSADVILIADAHAGGTANALGTELTATAGANTAGIDTVLADGAGDADAANDGAFSDTDTYVVSAANVSVVKSSVIISDPVNNTTNPKAIPGAVVEYCIAVSNAAGSATATDVVVTDTLPADVTYLSTFGIFLNGTVDGTGACNADGTAGGSFADPNVTGSLSDITAGLTRTLYFRVTID